MRPVDEVTAAEAIKTLQWARTRCISPVLALHQSGLLVTDELACNIRHDVLANTAEAVRRTRINALHQAKLIPKDPTPATMIKVIADRLDYLAERAKMGEFR